MSEKKRINEIAKETGFSNQQLVAKAQAIGLDVKSHSSSIEEADVKRLLDNMKGETPGETPKRSHKAVEKPAEPKEKPVTFQGKAVVIDEAILARQKAREAAKKGETAEKPAEKPAEKTSVKSDSPEKAAEKTPVKSDSPQSGANEPVVKSDAPKEAPKSDAEAPRKKSKFDTTPKKIQIKVVKKAEVFSDKPLKDRLKDKASGMRDNGRGRNDNRSTSAGRGSNTNGSRKSGNTSSNSGVQKRVFNDAPALPANDRRRRSNNKSKSGNQDSRFNDGNRAGGPLHVNDNRNQVRNARNSNWNAGGKRKKGTQQAPQVERKFVELPETFEYTEGMTIADIAKFLHREPAEFIKILFMMGVMATQNTSLDDETIELLLMELGVTPEKKVVEDKSDIESLFVEEGYLNESQMVTRPPVVTIMGHVDHGKTTLLDHLRKSRVTEGEAGGITQHIGAYQLELNGKKITFLDTPGHEAFTSMRARGASVTDITILVVAADDGVMPQTIEAINHSKAAGVPIVVAINKIDKDGANPQRVIQELAEHEVLSTEWGGDSEFVEISAKFDKNLDTLLETVLLVAEMQELKADPTVRAIGTVIEARLDKGKGAIATLLVQQGTLHQQDPIVAGNTFGRVRAMVNDLGRREKEAGPSAAVEITGLNDVPQAGDHFAVFEDEKTARAAGEERFKRAQLVQRQNTRRVSLENLFDTIKEGQLKTVDIIIKADAQGNAEALSTSLQKIEVEGVKVDIVHAGVGAINESDVSLAAASNALIIGYNVRPTADARLAAEREEVEIRLESVIYKVLEDIEASMKGMLDPEYEEQVVGEAHVQEIFTVSKVGTIAGFLVTSGHVTRDAHVRVIRDGVVLHDGAIASLKHLKDDVREVQNAQEGGLMIEDFNDVAPEDTLEVYEMIEKKR
ncbi:MAG: translation initiation factor IF-2 [Streptococcaceae bacterium]|jgi:translation initiation factor IF-2|nr:translation initiation factor IF-2 [Streptococcaceae bacterium]